MKICNVCGKKIRGVDGGELSISHYFGYESKFDGTDFHLDLCPECADLLAQMVRPLCKHDPMDSIDTLTDI